METKIEMGKQYKTRDGREVRVLCVDREHCLYTVVALVSNVVVTYTADGHQFSGQDSAVDLIEVKPRIVREYWVNVYQNGIGPLHATKANADAYRACNCLACVKIPIDCEEGEGLNDGT